MRCSIEGCIDTVEARQMCKKHYMREYMRGYLAQYRKRNAHKIKAWRRKSEEKKKAKLEALRKGYKIRYARHRERLKAEARHHALVRVLRGLGLDLDQYKRMLKAQKNRCAICRVVPEKGLCIDHCHRINKIRGLLCSSCNSGIGFLKDDPALLEKALTYLHSFEVDSSHAPE